MTCIFCFSCSWQDTDRWIGLQHTGDDACGVACSDQWTWTDGSSRNSDPRWNWQTAEPHPREDCGRLGTNALFFGISCSFNLKYMCKRGATCFLSEHIHHMIERAMKSRESIVYGSSMNIINSLVKRHHSVELISKVYSCWGRYSK